MPSSITMADHAFISARRADEAIEDVREILAAHHDEFHTTLKGQ
jgi:hypothetical protein